MHSAQAQSMMAAGLRDRLTLRLLRDSGEAPVEVMGFHAQQACEKFIKAVLVLHGVIFERTHDLALLSSLCATHRILVPADLDALRILNSFAVRFRYETCSVPLFDQLQATAMVEELREWAERELAAALD
ncbi:HEPN domain-containing protein [Candidatus Thiodictyon syntrophicum]|jgi:HEPN domain-containing protein|nr:HEPN domain-containing protein [Candidatus Thiodictyon syntrophicum]